ncbi:MAG TPA: Mrp/NBP35 family ATP-binding protein, partial [Thermodesulfobacteriota bacterium]
MPQAVTPDAVREALRQVRYPGFSRDVVSFGLVKDIQIDGGRVRVFLAVTARDPSIAKQIQTSVETAVRAIPGVTGVEIMVRPPAAGGPAPQPQPGARAPAAGASPFGAPEPTPSLAGVKRVVAVASGKGGVGKSTAAVNLALALARLGLAVGLMDADVYGPSVPLMLGVSAQGGQEGGRGPQVAGERRITPAESYGVRTISIGLFMNEDTPVVWRGPMVAGLVDQFLRDVEWGSLDVLLVDMPPGTGDAQLSLVQRVPLSGAIIVTTPQDAASTVARRGLMMFRQTRVPILGIVENMSTFACPHCGEVTDIFGTGGGEASARMMNVPFLGGIPIDPTVREGGDAGRPVVVSAPDSAAA